DQLVIGGGISALPSVHNGLAVLFALGASKLNRTAGWLFGAYALFIWIGAIHLGWHYAADGLVAAAATVILWKASGRLADWLDRPAVAAPEFATA
ncbi:MAG TPA: phosphatase PAP2 family protein, partial [Sphingomicrobium sp.]|nr:phosphatase PAP2 family protein [Sphingomicrobium sp.]